MEIFKDYKESSIFKDRNVLSMDWIPSKDLIVHRNKEMRDISFILQPILNNEKPSNAIIYGSSGTGKTLIIRTIINELNSLNKNGDFEIAYIKCSEYPTHFNLLLKISMELNLGYKGTRKGYYYEKLKEFSKGRIVVLVLDELDKMNSPNEPIFNLSRCENISIIGIANNLRLSEQFDSATLSSFRERKILVKKYNATQLKDILRKRAKLAFNEETISDGVIEKCAALSAQENGDARIALDLLKASGDIAEKEDSELITPDHVDKAEELIDVDIINEKVVSLTIQAKAVLASIIKLINNGQKEIQTGDVFAEYEKACLEIGLKQLTQRRISDLINEMDVDGIITTRINYKGRYGRTKDISLSFSPLMMKKIKNTLREDYGSYIN